MKSVFTLFIAVITLSAFAQNSFSKSEVINSAIEAARTGNMESIKESLEQGKLNINSQDEEGYTPLISAAAGGQIDVVELLLKNGADIELKTKKGQTALSAAINGDHYEVAQRLIGAGADVNQVIPNSRKDTLLIGSAGNNLETTKMILEKNKELLNKTNAEGETPLSRSVRFGNHEVTRYLIDQGAKRNIKDKKGLTALDIARQNKDQRTVNLLSTTE
ncbi:ankyrin repeat domain-containing protein [Bdellovibrio reynosensis]|uniref:Ankyrin repeat domain-containing protein n=1 Tax=Bdellovibrio reynosensis TaxID=2835041 RepID=A0ABY4C798_9BACT|nr:ankyrin repeat domain-containing protein [Bdellovibrio reynosensis]UOF00800.1 ankyrin repeat domain-containing protein [Bdellovibrio reynosensis]